MPCVHSGGIYCSPTPTPTTKTPPLSEVTAKLFRSQHHHHTNQVGRYLHLCARRQCAGEPSPMSGCTGARSRRTYLTGRHRPPSRAGGRTEERKKFMLAAIHLAWHMMLPVCGAFLWPSFLLDGGQQLGLVFMLLFTQPHILIRM